MVDCILWVKMFWLIWMLIWEFLKEGEKQTTVKESNWMLHSNNLYL